jgi:four helix bundle protein
MDHQRPAGHRNLIVWRKALDLARDVYLASSRFPRHETFGITAQIRRAAVSISSNIAEGAARSTTRDFVSFLHIARGSQAEVETQLRLAAMFGYLAASDLERLLTQTEEVGRMLTAMITTLRRRLVCGLSSLPASR